MQGGRPPPGGGRTGPRHLLISYGILAHSVTAPRSPEPPGPRARRESDLAEAEPGDRGRKAAPGVQGAEGGAVRGRVSEAGSRPALRAAAADAPNLKRGPARGSPPALTIYSQALGSVAAAPASLRGPGRCRAPPSRSSLLPARAPPNESRLRK